MDRRIYLDSAIKVAFIHGRGVIYQASSCNVHSFFSGCNLKFRASNWWLNPHVEWSSIMTKYAEIISDYCAKKKSRFQLYTAQLAAKNANDQSNRAKFFLHPIGPLFVYCISKKSPSVVQKDQKNEPLNSFIQRPQTQRSRKDEPAIKNMFHPCLCLHLVYVFDT